MDGYAVLLEENFVKNIHRVIGEEEPYFGKLLYLWLAKGFNRIKITKQMFIESLMPFLFEENKQKQLKLSYDILDIDRDGLLNILNILHLNKNLKPRTMLSREVKLIFEEYLNKNIINSSKRVNRIDITLESFQKIVISSCIRGEIRKKFFNVKERQSEMATNEDMPQSICSVLTDA